jgi:hypothetical protein
LFLGQARSFKNIRRIESGQHNIPTHIDDANVDLRVGRAVGVTAIFPDSDVELVFSIVGTFRC